MTSTQSENTAAITLALKRHWGFRSFKPLQEEVIASILEGRDSLAVLPTGGGKSLCFQLPALLLKGMAIVLSPLISLMKDQVDSLKGMGIAAEYLNSSQQAREQRRVVRRIQQGEVRILYISPERLLTDKTRELLKPIPLSFFVIDEAHCISQWGHDFREDYRNLNIIRDIYTTRSIHAFTASATVAVQRDISEQLRLKNPSIHIGRIDRPNLIYRVAPRAHILSQITDTLKKHAGEPGILYCLRRTDVDTISARLNALGYRNLPYHAGLPDETRRLHQEAFAREEVDIIVATVAFGMGIDRSNIRFVIHAAMPRSLEYYHQETGRAGRDSLPAHCYMFYGGGDFRIWNFLTEESPNREIMLEKLRTLYNFCSRPQCRHRAVAQYFGQDYDRVSCDACDFCLHEVDMVKDPLRMSQEILSCVAAVTNRRYGFGAGHAANILKGNATEAVTRWHHEGVPAFGRMAAHSVEFIRFMIEQLIGQDMLMRDTEYKTLSITETGLRVTRGEVVPRLAQPLVAIKKKEISRRRRQKRETEWAGVHQDLFNLLKKKRMELARRQGVPAFIIFGDKTLRDMAAVKPTTREACATVFGIGEHKLNAYADDFIHVVRQFLHTT